MFLLRHQYYFLHPLSLSTSIGGLHGKNLGLGAYPWPILIDFIHSFILRRLVFKLKHDKINPRCCLREHRRDFFCLHSCLRSAPSISLSQPLLAPCSSCCPFTKKFVKKVWTEKEDGVTLLTKVERENVSKAEAGQER